MRSQARQTTLARPVSKEGFGLHTGAPSSLTVRPAGPGTGLVFLLRSGERLPATAEQVVETQRCTTLGSAKSRIGTVEHLLSALFGLGVDNAEIAVDGEEVPACDGSAREWVALVRGVGVVRQEAPREELALLAPVWVEEGEAWAMAVPAPRFALSVGVDFGDPVVGRQAVSLTVTPARYARELAPARTFCFQEEIEELLAAGLAKGGSEENAVVIGPEGYSQPLRFPDEPVRHKAMDAVGDLALCGFRLRAHVILGRPSHRLNVALAGALRDLHGGRRF